MANPITQYNIPSVSSISSLVGYYRTEIQNGSMTPQQALGGFNSDMTTYLAANNPHGYDLSVLDPYKAQLFAPMQVNAGGKQGTLNQNGDITWSSTTINNSTTGGAGTSSSTSYQNLDGTTTTATPIAAPGTAPATVGGGAATVNTGNSTSSPYSGSGGYINAQGVYVPSSQTSGAPGAATGAQGGVGSLPSTGNPALDDLQSGFANLISGSIANGFTVNPALSITPTTLSQFINETASQLEPRYQQILGQEMININQTIGQLANTYQNQQGQDVQDFQQSLGNARNSAGQNGMYLGGGERALEQGLANSTNRSLSTLDVNAQTAIGQAMQAGGQALGQGIFTPLLQGTGSAPFSLQDLTANGIYAPNISSQQVGLQGGDSVYAGSATPGRTLNFNYDPNMYKYGSIPASFSSDFSNLLNQTANNYQQGMTATGLSNISSSSGLSL